MDLHTTVLIAFGLFCLFVPLDLAQLSFGVIGALVYGGIRSANKATTSRIANKKLMQFSKIAGDKGDAHKVFQPRRSVGASASSKPKRERDTNTAGKEELWQPSVQPISAPKFNADSFEKQVQELVGQISPTAEGDQIVQQLASVAKKMLHGLFPNAEVVGCASADVRRGTAFGVAIPEVDIILNLRPSMLIEHIEKRTKRHLSLASKIDAYKLHKAALRLCTDDLVRAGGFKFRRSSFKGYEPKVTLIAPASMGIHTESVPVSFSVNTVTPLYSAALLTACGQIDERARDLIVLVRRWAKDRGISHAAKGHLSPYAWGLLAIYFLQVNETDGGGPLLPALVDFKMSASPVEAKQKEPKLCHSPRDALPSSDGLQKSVAVLFAEFVSFYIKTFSWRNEAVSVRNGTRSAPSLSLPLHVVVNEKGCAEVALNIEDPINPKQNCGSGMTSVSIARLREELTRACELTSRQVPLSELLQPWAPLELDVAGEDE